MKTLTIRLFQPIDITPLVFFRIAFGGLMLWEVWRYFRYDRIARYYVEPSFFFHYYGFDWLRPLPGDGMFLLFHFLGILSFTILLGVFYRLSITLFWLCFTYVFLLDQAQYLNHFYLISLVSFLMIFIPAHRALSVDALLHPSIRTQVAPTWTLWLLRGQMALVYIFGGIAKINADWLAGEPLREWLGSRTDFMLIGHLFSEEWMIYLFSYGGMLLDLLIVPLLLWRRTRIPALLLVIGFHLTNAQLFNIGVFPYFSIAASLVFLPPHWFRLGFKPTIIETPPVSYLHHQRLILTGIVLYFAIQIFLPMRHWLYPGNPSWTEEGHTLAWHMRLRDKDAEIAFYASDPVTGTTWQVPARNFLSQRQFDQMKDNPQMILRFAHYLAGQIAVDEEVEIQVRAWSMTSLNSRSPQLLIDPTADLVRQPDTLLAADWILPLVQMPVSIQTLPRPALLVSRRYEDMIVLVNITETDYPLTKLQLHSGDETLDRSHFGVAALTPGECLLIHHEQVDLREIFLPCNETGSRQVVGDAFQNGTLHIQTGDHQTQVCDRVACVVAPA